MLVPWLRVPRSSVYPPGLTPVGFAALFEELVGSLVCLIERSLGLLRQQERLVQRRCQSVPVDIVETGQLRREMYVGELLGKHVLLFQTLKRLSFPYAFSGRNLPGLGPLR